MGLLLLLLNHLHVAVLLVLRQANVRRYTLKTCRIGGKPLSRLAARTRRHGLACCTQMRTGRRRLLPQRKPRHRSCKLGEKAWTAVRQQREPCCSAVPNFNPQNVPDPQVMPNKDFGPEECVRAQLEALKTNDIPWPNHGLQTAYEFGEDIGGMERSRYFGYSKDLYHFDHFLGHFQNEFPELLSLTEYSIKGIKAEKGGAHTVEVEVKKGNRSVMLQFLLSRKDMGRKKGALMTKTLKRI